MPKEVVYKPVQSISKDIVPLKEIYSPNFFIKNCELKVFHTRHLGFHTSTIYKVPVGKRFHLVSVIISTTTTNVAEGEYIAELWLDRSINVLAFAVVSSALNDERHANVVQNFSIPLIIQPNQKLFWGVQADCSGYVTIIGYEEIIEQTR